MSDDRIRKLEMFAQSRRNDPDNSAITTSHWVGYLEGLDAMKQIVTGKTPTDNSDEQRYGDMDSWPQSAHTMRQRLLRDELPDRERPARYSPDFTPIPDTLTVTYNVDDVREEVREGEGLLASDWEWTNEGTRRNYEAMKTALEQYDKEQA